MRILECLDNLSFGVRGKVMGVDMDHPPVVSSTRADPLATFADTLLASFNAMREAFVHFSPTVGDKQDPTLSEFTSRSRIFHQGCQSVPHHQLLH